MTTEVSAPRQVARVVWVSPDGNECQLDMRTSRNVVTVSSEVPLPVQAGDVVLLGDVEPRIETVPKEVWEEEPWVGVVKLRLDDVTVVDTGSWNLVPTSSVNYAVGNTVSGSKVSGVARVLDMKPLRHLDDNAGPAAVDRFRVQPSASPSFADFGGLAEVKARAQELIELPLARHEQLKAIKARPVKGVLFTGGPGTGKTMLAKIIANQAGAKFYEISGPQIFSKWFGESEELLRSIFADAKQQTRSIIFIDEIDSVAARRDGDSHEASRRVVAQLLTEMDGFKAATNVVVIAATNRVNQIDPALRRPGRFDWEIAFPKPSLGDRREILEIGAGKLTVAGTLQHDAIAALTEGWTAAELSAIWSEAALLAVKDGRAAIGSEDYLGGYERRARHLRDLDATSADKAAA